jgi:DNA invertase Pin-like site-specific DNA recombinase
MSSVSIYNPNKKHKQKDRIVDYELIYAMKDQGHKNIEIIRKLGIGQGTLRHALLKAKKEGRTWA